MAVVIMIVYLLGGCNTSCDDMLSKQAQPRHVVLWITDAVTVTRPDAVLRRPVLPCSVQHHITVFCTACVVPQFKDPRCTYGRCIS